MLFTVKPIMKVLFLLTSAEIRWKSEENMSCWVETLYIIACCMCCKCSNGLKIGSTSQMSKSTYHFNHINLLMSAYKFKRKLVVKTQQTYPCLKSTIKTMKKVWNMFKVNNKGTNQWCRSGVFIFNFEHISHPFRVILHYFLLAYFGFCQHLWRSFSWT